MNIGNIAQSKLQDNYYDRANIIIGKNEIIIKKR